MEGPVRKCSNDPELLGDSRRQGRIGRRHCYGRNGCRAYRQNVTSRDSSGSCEISSLSSDVRSTCRQGGDQTGAVNRCHRWIGRGPGNLRGYIIARSVRICASGYELLAAPGRYS